MSELGILTLVQENAISLGAIAATSGVMSWYLAETSGSVTRAGTAIVAVVVTFLAATMALALLGK